VSDDKVEIAMPFDKGKLVLLSVDEEYDVYFYTRAGLYQCFARITDRYKRDNLYIISLDMTSNLRKHQRREYYRFSCSLEMKTRNLAVEEIAAVAKNEICLVPGLPLRRSIIADISGGGLRFIASEQYEPGSLIYCNWQLVYQGTLKEYNLVGKVLFSEPIEKKPGEFEHRLQYINANATEREEIIHYIFEEERTYRKRKSGL